MVSLAPSFDTVGWMTRDIDTMIAVSDVVLADTLHGNDEHATKRTLENTTFGIASQLFSNVAHSEQCEAWLSKLRATFQCNDIANNQLCVEEIDNASVFRTLQGSEIWQTHGAWIEETSPDIANDIMLRLNWCKSIPQQDVIDAKTKQQQITQHINALFNSNDVLVIPTTPAIAPRIDASGTTLANDRNSLLTLTSLAGLTGLPQLHLPLFTLHNAPCGLSLVGRKGSDLALLSIAKAIVTTLNE
jgi:Asp-tRNA(Asn)/Glu-tRNA(Gln) amidotransferase A subunit family amidase